MQQIEVSAIQNKEVLYTIRQGIDAEIYLEWLEADETPSTLHDFRAQIRTDYASAGVSVLQSFSLTPDPSTGCYYTKNPSTGATVFYLPAAFTATLRANEYYRFEAKQLDAGGAPEASILIRIFVAPEVAAA